MASLHVPLPTLRPWPRGQTRTARGRRGSLLLRRIGLSPTTPGRSPGALPSLVDENLSQRGGLGTLVHGYANPLTIRRFVKLAESPKVLKMLPYGRIRATRSLIAVSREMEHRSASLKATI